MAAAYNASQIAQYEGYVGLPLIFRLSEKPALTLEYLTALHVHQIAAAPYENLILHYSTEHAVSLDPQHLFDKIVSNARGRGGYCMENSIFFNHVLRALGFQVYTTGARNRTRINGVPAGNYNGWVHIVNLVTLPDGSRYMLDVGFGGDGATKPLPLISGHVEQNLGSQEIRLVHDNLPEQLDKSQKFWIYEYRNGKDKDWNSFYCFPELEFLAVDFEIMNFYTSTSPAEMNFQPRLVLVIRFLREEQNVVGKVMMVGAEVKRNMGGKTVLVKTCTTERERVEALKEHFNITLTEEEIQGVKGRIVELLS